MPKMDLSSKGNMQMNPNKGKKMDFKPKGNRTAEEPSTEFQKAIKRENNRYQNAVSDNYYRIAMFSNFEQRREFLEIAGMEDARMVDGYLFEDGIQGSLPPAKKVQFKAGDVVPCEVKPDPEKDWEPQSEYFDENTVDQMFTVLNALKACGVKENAKHVADSGIYVVLVWANDDDRASAEQRLGFSKYGIKYLDGVRMLKDWQK